MSTEDAEKLLGVVSFRVPPELKTELRELGLTNRSLANEMRRLLKALIRRRRKELLHH